MIRRLLILVLILSIGLAALLNRSLYTYMVHVVLSGSMGKAAPKGSLIVSQRLEPSQYRVGDIVTFPLPADSRELVTHRITRIQSGEHESMVETKGDANPNGDGWTVPASHLVGRVAFVIPIAGYGALALQTAIGFLLFALVTFLLIVFPLLRAAFQEVRVQKNQAS